MVLATLGMLLCPVKSPGEHFGDVGLGFAGVPCVTMALRHGWVFEEPVEVSGDVSLEASADQGLVRPSFIPERQTREEC